MNKLADVAPKWADKLSKPLSQLDLTHLKYDADYGFIAEAWGWDVSKVSHPTEPTFCKCYGCRYTQKEMFDVVSIGRDYTLELDREKLDEKIQWFLEHFEQKHRHFDKETEA
jgi:hypothetical protein